jgi:hypothetical protein
MTSFVNLLASDVWSEADIVNRGRAVIAAQVSEARQNELRTILLGHIAGMRTAAPEEMAEIALVQSLTEAQVVENARARADMALLGAVLAFEADPSLELDAAALALYGLRHPETIEPNQEQTHD